MSYQMNHTYGLSNPESIPNTALAYNSIVHYTTSVPVVYNTQTCKETLRVLFSYPKSKCIVVVDLDHRPVGLVMNNRFYLQMLSSTRTEELYNQSITRMMNHCSLVVDIHISIDKMLEDISKLPGATQSDCVIVTENDRLAGIIHVTDGLLPKQLV